MNSIARQRADPPDGASVRWRGINVRLPSSQVSSLTYALIRREISSRYRGSVLGVLWSLLTPLLMLSIYTFVFSNVFQARWQHVQASGSTNEFGIILFAGLIVFQLFAEVIGRSPTLVLANVNYVKKVVFPLEALPVVATGSALFQAGVSLIILAAFVLAIQGSIPLSAALLPIVLAPFVIAVLGMSWLFSALGVYVRDLSQFINALITALLFLSPIFYPVTALPQGLRPFIFLNPITFPVEQTRELVVWGNMPDWLGLAAYTVFAGAIFGSGLWWFEKTRSGFADVL